MDQHNSFNKTHIILDSGQRWVVADIRTFSLRPPL